MQLRTARHSLCGSVDVMHKPALRLHMSQSGNVMESIFSRERQPVPYTPKKGTGRCSRLQDTRSSHLRCIGSQQDLPLHVSHLRNASRPEVSLIPSILPLPRPTLPATLLNATQHHTTSGLYLSSSILMSLADFFPFRAHLCSVFQGK